MRLFIGLWFWFMVYIGNAQSTVMHTLTFTPIYGKNTFDLDSVCYPVQHTDSISFSHLSYYISNIELVFKNKTVWKEENSYHLIDVENIYTQAFHIYTPQSLVYDHLVFYIGIDSTTNVSGAMGGDLDPTKGMYWTWQSGFINLKLEGQYKKSGFKNQEFQYHIGGYQNEFNTYRKISLKTAAKKDMDIWVDIEKLFSNTDLSVQHHIMSPGKEAVLVSEKFASMFKLK
jgi:hypothetical protein